MTLQYNVQEKKIYATHRIDIVKFLYTDYVIAERCFNRLIRKIQKETERYYLCEITINDRTGQRIIKEIKPTR